MTHLKVLFSIILWGPLAFAQNQPAGTVNIPIDQYNAMMQAQQPDCIGTMLNGLSQGISSSLQAQEKETQSLIDLSKQYFEQERQCGNDLAEATLELNKAKADHEEKLMQLPVEIELQKLEHEEAMLAVQQECEQSSGSVFTEWKQMVSQGVVTPERGGPMALFSRGRNINRYRKLFYDDCLAAENNLKRVDILARKLNANIRKLQAGIDASAMKLASLSKNLSFKQGIIAKNCMKAKEQLDYQSALVRNQAQATRSATRTQNFLQMLSGSNVCLGGPGQAIPTGVPAQDTTAAGV